MSDIQNSLLKDLTSQQKEAVKSNKRCLLLIAGAGSGKTEVMARKIAWWVGVAGVSREKIVAFTFTERAAEEMKFRIRQWLQVVTPTGQEVALGGMYVGTIHGFCLAKLREYWPDLYHNYDILDEGSRAALILRGFNGVLGLNGLREAMSVGKEFKAGRYSTFEAFTSAYDQLHEHNQFSCSLPTGIAPFALGEAETEWCKKAKLTTATGSTAPAKAFAKSAARYYAYMRCRRFLDFSTSQSEFVTALTNDSSRNKWVKEQKLHLVVDEVQDINPVQRELIDLLIGKAGSLIAVGDHRQAIYGFRGAKVRIVGDLWQKFKDSADSEVIELQENFRSTPRIIELANRWAGTIGQVGSMLTPPMKHGNVGRTDFHPSHLGLVNFDERHDEAKWIAKAIRVIVPADHTGVRHDKRGGSYRGLTLSDIAILVRSSSDVRTYMRALEEAKIPCVVRAGPDLFSQPEVLLFISALAMSAGVDKFLGSPNPKSLTSRISKVLGCGPDPKVAFRAAARVLRRGGLGFDPKAEERLFRASEAIYKRLSGELGLKLSKVQAFRTPKLRKFLASQNQLRRVFPQDIFHLLLAESQIETWDTGEGRGQTALFHLGALSALITGIETPGWTSVSEYKWQVIGLCQYGAEEGRADEQPLMVQPDAVSISTIHAAKGLEFAGVFLADVCARRFPSSMARREALLPMSGKILKTIDADGLSDNDNYDGERRLMYVAITRSERFLFISYSGDEVSKFIKEIAPLIEQSGGLVTGSPQKTLKQLQYASKEYRRDVRLATSFSDLRYYLECPHDFYLRKVLGFSPTIDQAFGYGRGVHNLMRAVHSDPKKWAALAENPKKLSEHIQKLIDSGLFYLRYTTGNPADNMRAKGLAIVSAYIKRYAGELRDLTFEPEKEFETLVEYDDEKGGALISGAIDIVRRDDPPRVTLIDFKSGHPESDKHQKLSEEEMQFQVALYAIAAKRELQYQPNQGLVRYLDTAGAEKSELQVPLDEKSVQAAKTRVAQTAVKIRDRQFIAGPAVIAGEEHRCATCDFTGLCGAKEAIAYKTSNPNQW